MSFLAALEPEPFEPEPPLYPPFEPEPFEPEPLPPPKEPIALPALAAACDKSLDTPDIPLEILAK